MRRSSASTEITQANLNFKGKRKLKKFSSVIKKAVSALLAAAMLLCVSCGSVGSVITGAILDKEIYVSEFMALNTSTIIDMDGDPEDWIEIKNNTDRDINLKGYTLSDDPEKPYKWEFPDCTVKANGHIIVFASGKNKEINGELHTNFALSSSGERIILTTDSGRVVSDIEYGKQNADISTGVFEENGKRKLVSFYEATPGLENAGDYIDVGAVIEQADFTLAINEITPRNAYSHYTQSGTYEQWVEIINKSSGDVKISEYYLSDDAEKPLKYRLPDVTLKAGEVIVIFITGEAASYADIGEYHTNFSMSAEENVIFLSHISGAIADSAEISADMRKNNSYGRSPDDFDKWVYFARPTPNKPNTTEQFETLTKAAELNSSSLIITEVSTANVSGLQLTNKTYGKKYGLVYSFMYYADWIELYNPTDKEISLSDYMLGNDKSLLTTFALLPDYKIGAGEYKVIFIGLEEDYYVKKSQEIGSILHLSAEGDTVFLVEKESGEVVDFMDTGRQFDYVTVGRKGMTDSAAYYFQKATPGEENIYEGVNKVSRQPEFSHDGGPVEAGTVITLKAPTDSAKIYYTTDGSMPNATSKIYTDGIKIDKTTVIRAVALEEGKLVSIDVTRTFFVNFNHKVAVLSVAGDPDGFYNKEYGLFGYPYDGVSTTHGGYITKLKNRGLKSVKTSGSIEFYKDGNLNLQLDAELSLFGQYSLVTDQKSFKVELKSKYGIDEINYPLIETNEVTVYNDFVLRQGGYPDSSRTRILDLTFARLAKTSIDIDVMDGIPVVVYINGEYHGIYNLRERFDVDYIVNHFGADPENVDMIKGNKTILYGSLADYNALKSYVTTHDLRVPEYYEYVCSQVDIESLMNWWAMESFLVNTDSGNIKFFRDKENGKWRWFLFDLDWSLFGSNYTGKYDMLKQFAFDPKGHGIGNGFETWLMCGLVENEDFRERFIHNYMYVIHYVFEEDRVSDTVDYLASLIEEEIPNHIERWKTNNENYANNEYRSSPGSLSGWKNAVEGIKTRIEKRKPYALKEIKNFFKLTDKQMEYYATYDINGEPYVLYDMHGNPVTAEG